MLTIKGAEQRKAIVQMPKIEREILVAKPISASPVFISDKVSSAIDTVLEKHLTNRQELFSRRRDAPIVAARRDLMKIMYHDFNWSAQRIANYLKMDLSTVQYHLGLRMRSKVKRGPFKPA